LEDDEARSSLGSELPMIVCELRIEEISLQLLGL